ncbi:MAG: aspartate kinase [Euryarchaeota archaeon]|nr:aspartate kinase [Euryarchaeota archaeon]
MAIKRLVMKFGGTSVGSGERIRGVAEIVKAHRARETVVVVSAMSTVTNQLVDVAQEAINGITEEDIKDFARRLKEKHARAIRVAVAREHQGPPLQEVERLSTELEKVLVGISYVGELTPRSMDYVLSFGERMSAPILSGALKSQGIESSWFSGYEAGIVTDSSFGKANPLWAKTNRKIKRVLGRRTERGEVPVVTGFVAGDEKGRITTLSRGGSDFSAAIIGSALKADEIWIWTDVDGVYTTDPRMVKQARTIDVISFAEAMELAYFGARVLHPKTIEPAMEKDIPVRVRNTFKPEHRGTLIVREQKKIKEIVKAVTVLDDCALLTISGVGMIGVPGVAARVFTALAAEKVNIMMISQGSSEVNISLVVEKGDLNRAIRTIKKTFPGKDIVKDVTYDKDIAVIAVIGAGMRGTKGVAARVFRAAADAGVNVLMIAQGSSEVNISFVVAAKDAKKGVVALHKEFIAE